MNTITIELCAEDRARLDRLAAALEANAPVVVTLNTGENRVEPAAPEKPAEPEQEAPTPTEEPTEKEAPAESKNEAQTAPSVTLEQIQQKVIQLAAGYGGKKKAKAREIINAYAPKVSDLKDSPEKWDEIWQQLEALAAEA